MLMTVSHGSTKKQLYFCSDSGRLLLISLAASLDSQSRGASPLFVPSSARQARQLAKPPSCPRRNPDHAVGKRHRRYLLVGVENAGPTGANESAVRSRRSPKPGGTCQLCSDGEDRRKTRPRTRATVGLGVSVCAGTTRRAKEDAGRAALRVQLSLLSIPPTNAEWDRRARQKTERIVRSATTTPLRACVIFPFLTPLSQAVLVLNWEKRRPDQQ
jgi:hypothetical protein